MTSQMVNLTFVKDVTLDTGRVQATARASVEVTVNVVDLRIVLVDAYRDEWLLIKLDHLAVADERTEEES